MIGLVAGFAVLVIVNLKARKQKAIPETGIPESHEPDENDDQEKESDNEVQN